MFMHFHERHSKIQKINWSWEIQVENYTQMHNNCVAHWKMQPTLIFDWTHSIHNGTCTLFFLLSLTPPAATAIAFAQCILWFWTILMVFVSHGLVGVLCLLNHISQLIVVYQKRLSLQQFTPFNRQLHIIL